MGLKSGHKLNLKQCKILAANGFLNKDHTKDYVIEEVQDRMWELEAKRDEKLINDAIKRFDSTHYLNTELDDKDLPPPIPSECDEGLESPKVQSDVFDSMFDDTFEVF